MPVSVKDDLEARSIAGKVRWAVATLNSALAEASQHNLHVEMSSIHAQDLDQRYGRDIYHVTIERREPL